MIKIIRIICIIWLALLYLILGILTKDFAKVGTSVLFILLFLLETENNIKLIYYKMVYDTFKSEVKMNKKRLEEFTKIKELIHEYIEEASCGIFNTRNLVGDMMINLFDGEYFQLDICYNWEYFEVFGTKK